MPTARQRPRHIACRMASIERPVCFKRTRERRGQAALTVTGARLWSRRPISLERLFDAPERPKSTGYVSSLRCRITRKRLHARETLYGRCCRRAGQDAGIRRLVEPDGIEPTTSCLQSTRSPN